MLNMDQSSKFSDSSDAKDRPPRNAERSSGEYEPLESPAVDETPTEDVEETAHENSTRAGTESNSDNDNQYRGYHIKPPSTANKQGCSGYYISKVTSEIKTAQPAPSKSIGKVFVLPKQTMPIPVYENARSSLQSQPGTLAPVQAAHMHINIDQMSIVPQTVNRFIWKPFSPFTSTNTTGTNVNKLYNQFRESLHTIKAPKPTGSEVSSNSEITSHETSLTAAVNDKNKHEFVNSYPNNQNRSEASSVTKAHENRDQFTKISPQCYRDIRQSLSRFIYNPADKDLSDSETAWQAASSSQNIRVDLSTDKSETCKIDARTISGKKLSETDLASTDHINQLDCVSDYSSKQPDCGTDREKNEVNLVVNNEHEEIKTPVKAKRSRKPKVYFSPSGNHIPGAFGNVRVSKGPRKRKLAENTLNKQYFGALQRTFAKRTKPLSPKMDSDMNEETTSNDIEASTSRISQNKYQESDYKLKQKAVLNASSATASAETVNSHHLLKKLDPSDLERQKSLAVFSKRYQMQESKPVQSYKISFASSLGQVHKKQIDERERTNIEGQEISTKRASQTSLSENKELTSESCEEFKVPNDSTKANEVADERSSMTRLTDVKKCHEPTENNASCSNSDLDPAKSISSTLPTVVLQKMTGITPIETVQVSQILKQTPFTVPPENKQSSKEFQENIDKQMENQNIQSTTEIKEKSRKDNDYIKSVGNEEGKSKIVKTKKYITAKVAKKLPQRNDMVQEIEQSTTEKARDKGILHKLLFSDEQTMCPKEKCSEIKVDKCTDPDHKTDTSQTSGQCRKSIMTNSNETDGATVTNSTNLASLSNMNTSQTLNLTQPIPVFYSTKGRLVPGPMPIISDTSQYTVAKGLAGNTMLPAVNSMQPCVGRYPEGKEGDNRVSSSDISQFKVMSTNIPVKDPTGILTPVPKEIEPVEKRKSVSSKGKTVADLLKERRSDQYKDKDLVGQPNLNFVSPVSTFLRRENKVSDRDDSRASANELTKKDNQQNSTADKGSLRMSPATTFTVKTDASSERFSRTPEKPVSDHLYSTSWHQQTPLKPPFRSASYSPLPAIAGMEHEYSRSLSSDFARRLSSEVMKPTDLIENNATKYVPTSPHVPLKIVLPSLQSQRASVSSVPTINLPVTVKTLPELSTQQSDGNAPSHGNAKSTEMTKVDTTRHSGIQSQANQSFAVRIGDKMYIIRPAFQVEPAKINAIETSLSDDRIAFAKPETKPAPKVAKTPKTSKKRKSPANLEKQFKPHQPTTHQKDMKKKIKKLMKKNKTPIEELIQSLGLEHNKEKRKKLRRKPSHKITYSSTPSPAHSTHDTSESPLPVKQEPVTPDVGNVSGADTNATTPEVCSLKPRTKATRVVEKRATILQIFKSASQSSKFYMHTAKLCFTTGGSAAYHRWYHHSDYPCTLHLRNSDTIYQIDVESLRSGFYLVSEMDKNLLKSDLPEKATVSALLSLYPPDMNILPEESLAIAVGKINDYDETEQPIPSDNENDTVNKNVDNIIRSILKLDTFKDIEHIEDERYGSVKDVTMSPKCHSRKFYAPEMFDCFTQNRRSGVKNSPAMKISSTDKSVSGKSSLEDIQESEVTVSTKAHELKIKQNELYQECSKLRDKIQTGKGLLLATSIARNLGSCDELGAETSRDDENVSDFESVSSDSQSVLAYKLPGATQNNVRGRNPRETNDEYFEDKLNANAGVDQQTEPGFDRNVNCCVERRKRSRKVGWSKRSRVINKGAPEFHRCTRSFTVKL